MTREQIEAIERDIKFGLGAGQTKWARSKAKMALNELLAAARRAVELEEALEFAASDKASLYKTGDGRYCCVLFEGGAGVEENFYGSTPLEAINNTRRGM